jgi:hypothetical protein
MSKPQFIAYSVIEREKKEKPHWHPIGAAWKQTKGEGYNLQLDSLPIDGRIVLLPPKADD